MDEVELHQLLDGERAGNEKREGSTSLSLASSIRRNGKLTLSFLAAIVVAFGFGYYTASGKAPRTAQPGSLFHEEESQPISVGPFLPHTINQTAPTAFTHRGTPPPAKQRETEVNRGTTTQSVSFESARTWYVDPVVYSDETVKAYPNETSPAVYNAKYLAAIIKKKLQIDGFEVRVKGKLVGSLPVLYMGFPKHGTTAAFDLIAHSTPCLIDRDMEGGAGSSELLDLHGKHFYAKEPFFWTRMDIHCTMFQERLIGCDDGEVVNAFLEYVTGRFPTNEGLLRKSLQCSPPIWIDGSTSVLWNSRLRVLNSHLTDQPHLRVPFFPLVAIHELTPQARFLALARPWDAAIVRSNWWFRHEKNGVGNRYRQALERITEKLKHLSTQLSPGCDLEFGFPWESGLVKPHAWANSCSLAAVTKLFGDQRLFITEVGPLLRCKTDFFAWFARGLQADLHLAEHELPRYGAECRPSEDLSRNGHNKSREKAEITPEIKERELELLRLARMNLIPLLHRGGDGS